MHSITVGGEIALHIRFEGYLMEDIELAVLIAEKKISPTILWIAYSKDIGSARAGS
jgi:hypothetical protein